MENKSQNIHTNSELDLSTRANGRDGEISTQVYRLTLALLESRIENKKGLERFVKRVETYVNALSPEAKKLYLTNTVGNFYANEKWGLGEHFMEIMKLDSKQQKDLSRLVALDAMVEQSDPDGITSFTFWYSVARVLKFYPDLANDPEMRQSAKEAFKIELNDLSGFSNGLSRPQVYIDMGLVAPEEIFEDEKLVTSIENKYLSALKQGHTELCLALREKYISAHSPLLESDAVLDAAKIGFNSFLRIYPGKSKMFAIEFLPDGFLSSDEAVKAIESNFIEAAKEGSINSAADLSLAFREQLSKKYSTSGIWESDISEDLEKHLIENLKTGYTRGIGKFIDMFGLPKSFRDPEFVNGLAVSCIRENMRRESVESTLELISAFNLREEIWDQVFDGEYVAKIFIGSEKLDVGHLARYIEKLDIEIKLSNLEVSNFVSFVASTVDNLNPANLYYINRLCNVFPQIKEHLNISAGPNFPQNSTIADLLEIAGNSSLIKNSIYGLNAFDIEEVREICALLNKSYGDLTSNTAVSFFNVLKRSGILERISEEQKALIIKWVRKFGAQAVEHGQKGDRDPMNRKLISTHWNRNNGQFLKETPSMVADMLFRHKADSFASAIEIMNDPTLIDEIGEFIDKTDPNKLYKAWTKPLTRMLNGHFKRKINK